MGPFSFWCCSMTRTSQSSRNSFLVQGVPKYSRAAMYGKRGKYLKKDWKPVEKKAEAPVATKAPKWYPAEDLPSRRPVRKAAPKPTKLRASITPGTVLILLSGQFFAEEEKPKNTVSDARKADQKSVDDAIMASVKATAGLKEYLGARFALTNGQFPHEMNF